MLTHIILPVVLAALLVASITGLRVLVTAIMDEGDANNDLHR